MSHSGPPEAMRTKSSNSTSSSIPGPGHTMHAIMGFTGDVVLGIRDQMLDMWHSLTPTVAHLGAQRTVNGKLVLTDKDLLHTETSQPYQTKYDADKLAEHRNLRDNSGASLPSDSISLYNKWGNMKDGSQISDWFEKEPKLDVEYAPMADFKTHIEGNLQEGGKLHLCYVDKDKTTFTHHVLVSNNHRVLQWTCYVYSTFRPDRYERDLTYLVDRLSPLPVNM